MVDFEMQTDFYYQQGKKGLFFFLKKWGKGVSMKKKSFSPNYKIWNFEKGLLV